MNKKKFFLKEFLSLDKELIEKLGINETYVLTFLIEELKKATFMLNDWFPVAELSKEANGLSLRELEMVVNTLISNKIIEKSYIGDIENSFYRIDFKVLKKVVGDE